MLAEKRKHKRIPLHYYLKVSEVDSRKHLGYIIDVSMEGFKLLSEEQIPSGCELLCSVNLPEVIHGRETISFKARSCWSGKDVNPDYYVSGYHINEIDPIGVKVISSLIYNYGHNL